jgi:hypothetical protein
MPQAEIYQGNFAESNQKDMKNKNMKRLFAFVPAILVG